MLHSERWLKCARTWLWDHFVQADRCMPLFCDGNTADGAHYGLTHLGWLLLESLAWWYHCKQRKQGRILFVPTQNIHRAAALHEPTIAGMPRQPCNSALFLSVTAGCRMLHVLRHTTNVGAVGKAVLRGSASTAEASHFVPAQQAQQQGTSIGLPVVTGAEC